MYTFIYNGEAGTTCTNASIQIPVLKLYGTMARFSEWKCYIDINEKINLRVQFYQLEKKEEWKYDEYFFTKTYNSTEINDELAITPSTDPTPNVNAFDEFKMNFK